MKLMGYGVELSNICPTQLEKIRGWRNHPDIMNVSINKEKISKNQQIEWFNSLCNKNDRLYLIVSYKGEHIGMVSAISDSRHKDNHIMLSEIIIPGLYIAPDCKYKNTVLAFCPSLVFIDYLFKQGQCIELQAQVYESNESAIRYNRALGYKLGNVDEQGLLTMTLKVNDFESAKKELSKILRF